MNNDNARLRERLVALTRDLVLIPGSSERPDEIQRALQWVRNHLESLEDIAVGIYDSNGVPSLVARPVGDTPIDVLFCAHIDVVHHPAADSYESHIRGSRLFGPGTGDMKGIVAILFELFRHFHLRSPGVPLAIAITADEEEGGENGTRALFEDFGLHCNVAMVPDGGSPEDIVVEEKGILHLRLESTGAACHAARPWLGHNALEHILTAIRNIQDRFPAPDPGARHWHPTCAVTRIDTLNRSVNRVPSHATATLDIRFPPPRTAGEMLADMTAALPKEVTCTPIITADPTVLSPDPAYFDACEDITGVRPDKRREHGGSDARFIAARGIPVIMSRPLCGNLHSRNEWIDIDSMVQFYQIYQRYLEDRFGL